MELKIENMEVNLEVKMLTEKRMFFLSWLTALGSGIASTCFMTDTDSPAKDTK